MKRTDIISQMIGRKLSLREMARELGIPKSTLYYHLTKNKDKGYKELIELFKENKKQMSQKGGIAKANKYKGGNKNVK